MAVVGIRALKQNASAVVAEAAAGELVTITDRGRPVAQMGPLLSDRITALVAAGRARPARGSLVSLPRPARRRRGSPPLSDVLEEMRDRERY
jgi:antitoxin (DNA-binding transcriptional repressor) of toxin-antitoxin stability system